MSVFNRGDMTGDSYDYKAYQAFKYPVAYLISMLENESVLTAA